MAFYFLDLIPPEVAEQYQIPNSMIVYDDVPTLNYDKPEAIKPMTIFYKETAEYTEIARINRLKGTVTLSAFSAQKAGFRVSKSSEVCRTG